MTETDQDEQFLIDSKGIAFPKLTYRQLALLEPLGKRRTLNKGEYLYKTGHREFGMTVVLTGAMEVIERCDGREHVISTKEPVPAVYRHLQVQAPNNICLSVHPTRTE